MTRPNVAMNRARRDIVLILFLACFTLTLFIFPGQVQTRYKNIRITDCQGELNNNTFPYSITTKIDISDLDDGIYYLRTETAHGMYFNKIIILK